MKCVECGNETDANQGTAKNPLCPRCYSTLAREHGTYEAEAVETRKKNCWRKSLWQLILILLIAAGVVWWMIGAENDYKKLPPVSNSSYDSSVRQVKEYILKNLNDPESCKFVSWSQVEQKVSGNDTTYKIGCKFRAKNAFNAYILESKVFRLDKSGNVFSYIYKFNLNIIIFIICNFKLLFITNIENCLLRNT